MINKKQDKQPTDQSVLKEGQTMRNKKIELKTKYNRSRLNNKHSLRSVVIEELDNLISDLQEIRSDIPLDMFSADLQEKIKNTCKDRIENLNIIDDLVSDLCLSLATKGSK
jgi:hypothetical protein